jgi:1-acyl-sn-glycerol-3-phosphate acyltransferase
MKNTKESKLYLIIRPIISFLFKFFFTPKIIGKENIPQEGKIILAGNHTANLDCILLISSTKREIHFLAKKELFEGPKKIIFSHLGLIPVDRQNKSHNSLVLAENYLNNNKVIGIFPEGTFHKEPNTLLPFKIGAVKIASDTNTKIVPFNIQGKYHPFSKTLKITFGKPISILNTNLDYENQKLKDTIISLGKE